MKTPEKRLSKKMLCGSKGSEPSQQDGCAVISSALHKSALLFSRIPVRRTGSQWIHFASEILRAFRGENDLSLRLLDLLSIRWRWEEGRTAASQVVAEQLLSIRVVARAIFICKRVETVRVSRVCCIDAVQHLQFSMFYGSGLFYFRTLQRKQQRIVEKHAVSG
mmetsp:Transcript_10052/g.24744  ORF Transcript_10052/g.24744 Transcript_10052/m.24744 type:complete len:164 (+) Transcript_10052:356-847(+)